MSGTTETRTPETEQPKVEDSKNEITQEQYKSLQSDYTRKSQELAKLKKEREEAGQGSEPTSEEVQLKGWLKENGFASVKDLEAMKQQTLEESKFRDLLKAYPSLADQEQAIRDLQKVHGGSFEEIAINYKFTTSDKLEKARSSRGKMVGDSGLETKTKSISEMSQKEWKEWKAKNAKRSSFGKAKSF